MHTFHDYCNKNLS